jgi:hypothetical protein
MLRLDVAVIDQTMDKCQKEKGDSWQNIHEEELVRRSLCHLLGLDSSFVMARPLSDDKLAHAFTYLGMAAAKRFRGKFPVLG